VLEALSKQIMTVAVSSLQATELSRFHERRCPYFASLLLGPFAGLLGINPELRPNPEFRSPRE
jgi:hypothetical protein